MRDGDCVRWRKHWGRPRELRRVSEPADSLSRQAAPSWYRRGNSSREIGFAWLDIRAILSEKKYAIELNSMAMPSAIFIPFGPAKASPTRIKTRVRAVSRNVVRRTFMTVSPEQVSSLCADSKAYQIRFRLRRPV